MNHGPIFTTLTTNARPGGKIHDRREFSHASRFFMQRSGIGARNSRRPSQPIAGSDAGAYRQTVASGCVEDDGRYTGYGRTPGADAGTRNRTPYADEQREARQSDCSSAGDNAPLVQLGTGPFVRCYYPSYFETPPRAARFFHRTATSLWSLCRAVRGIFVRIQKAFDWFRFDQLSCVLLSLLLLRSVAFCCDRLCFDLLS